jgi:hypothetical protein
MFNHRGIEVVCDADFAGRYPISREYMTLGMMIDIAAKVEQEKPVMVDRGEEYAS